MRERKVKEMDEKLTIWDGSAAKHEKKRKGLELRKFMNQNSEIMIRVIALACAVLVFASGMLVRYVTEKKLREEFAVTLSAERMRVEQETIAWMKEVYGINDQNATVIDIGKKRQLAVDSRRIQIIKIAFCL